MGYCRLVARREYRALQLANVRLLLGDVRLELRLLVVVVVQSRVERQRAAKSGLRAGPRMRNIRRKYEPTWTEWATVRTSQPTDAQPIR